MLNKNKPFTINAMPNNNYRSITKLNYVGNYTLELHFDDGVVKQVNLDKFIGKGVSAKLGDIDFFKQVKVENGYLLWPNNYDLCPNTLYNF